jgi:hypothetical protein
MHVAHLIRGGTRRAVPMSAVLLSCVLSVGCSGTAPTPPTSAAASSPAPSRPDGALPTRQGELGALTAKGLLDALGRDGFPAHNPVDTTAQECPAAGCLQSIVTDRLRVKSFPTTGQAQIYAADRNLYQVTTLVVDFAPPVTPAQRLRYQAEIQKLVN